MKRLTCGHKEKSNYIHIMDWREKVLTNHQFLIFNLFDRTVFVSLPFKKKFINNICTLNRFIKKTYRFAHLFQKVVFVFRLNN